MKFLIFDQTGCPLAGGSALVKNQEMTNFECRLSRRRK
ncbi:hypothetical protein D1AOALGA4SA_6724 [Olavius algarvensis Delta 1 endosymbiont]|nr:hypothetical protein D1AOALGA4SA_6724 [Olavius algarvensis Delta 1 endosymbiont]